MFFLRSPCCCTIICLKEAAVPLDLAVQTRLGNLLKSAGWFYAFLCAHDSSPAKQPLNLKLVCRVGSKAGVEWVLVGSWSDQDTILKMFSHTLDMEADGDRKVNHQVHTFPWDRIPVKPYIEEPFCCFLFFLPPLPNVVIVHSLVCNTEAE